MDPADKIAPPRARPPQHVALPRWYHLVYLLVAFALFAISLSLYLSYQYMQIYARSVAVNRQWMRRLHHCSTLGELAAGINAPANDVFQSHEVAAEEARLQAAVQMMRNYLNGLDADLQAKPDEVDAVPLVPGLQSFQQLTTAMAAEAQIVFEQLRTSHSKEAALAMAAMNRRHAEANETLQRLRGTIMSIQTRHFENQITVADSLQQFQYAVSTFIVLMIGGSLAYGRKLRRQVEAATREKERSIEALHDSEAQLERRVRDRTTELSQANLLLQKEVDERRRAEEALRQSEGRLRSLMEVRRRLLKKLMSAQEDERRRIAQDLHDEIGQALTSLLIGLRTVAYAPNMAQARSRAEDLRRITISTIEEVRRLARGLRPRVLDDLGLPAALERFATDYAQTHAIEIEVEVSTPTSERLPEEIETALYRIAQEALTNTSKHAAARHARVLLRHEPACVQLIVSDDGCGISAETADTEGQLGLSGMRERAALLNGTVAIESDKDKGTQISVSIPFGEDNHDANPCRAGG
jgi:signal transduction histidine kinase